MPNSTTRKREFSESKLSAYLISGVVKSPGDCCEGVVGDGKVGSSSGVGGSVSKMNKVSEVMSMTKWRCSWARSIRKKRSAVIAGGEIGGELNWIDFFKEV